jgi:hypothetical protein
LFHHTQTLSEVTRRASQQPAPNALQTVLHRRKPHKRFLAAFSGGVFSLTQHACIQRCNLLSLYQSLGATGFDGMVATQAARRGILLGLVKHAGKNTTANQDLALAA